MPLKFEFLVNQPGQVPALAFSCKLQCVRCDGTTAKGARCKRRVCIGTPYCPAHLKKEMNLNIADSLLAGAGKGLFAYDPDDPDGNEIVFRPKDVIVQYDGEIISEAELGERYGEHTAPYGLQEKYGVMYTEDGACRRGAGTLANHKPHSQANAKLSFGSGRRRFQLVATKNIRNGQEIYVSYGRAYKFDEPTLTRTVKTRR